LADAAPGAATIQSQHWFTKVDDHITYLMMRIDPDKVTPHKDETASQAYLREQRR
jgi:hypothetical protein